MTRSLAGCRRDQRARFRSRFDVGDAFLSHGRSHQAGDEQANVRADERRHLAGEAFRNYHERVYRFLLGKTRNHHEAEELTQRVFVDAVVALQEAETSPRSVLPWLFAIAERRFIDDVRRRVVARRYIALLGRSEEADDVFYSRDVAEALRLLIAELPEEQRQVVVMKILEGRSFAEIAERVGSTEAACKMRLSRAIGQLKVRLNEKGIRPSV